MPDQRETVDAVLDAYGGLSAYQIATLTHEEAPWRDARGDTPPGERSNAEITTEAMQRYYSKLDYKNMRSN